MCARASVCQESGSGATRLKRFVRIRTSAAAVASQVFASLCPYRGARASSASRVCSAHSSGGKEYN